MSEQETVDFLKRKDEAAFSYLYDNYGALLYAVILKITEDETTSEEILQEVFIKIWTGLDKYAHEVRNMLVWMLDTARITAVDMIMTKPEILKRKVYAPQAKLNVETSTGNIFIIHLLASEPGPKPQHKMLLQLVYHRGCSIGEIAYALDLPEAVIQSHLRKAFTELRNKLPV